MFRRFQAFHSLILFLILPMLFLGLAARYAQDAGAASGTAYLSAQVPSVCNPVLSGDRPGEGQTTHALIFDGDVKSYFDSTHSNWQYVQIDFNCVGTFSALRRYMTADGSDATGNRGPQGERVSYSLDGAAWTDLTANTTFGWEDYFNYGNDNQAWHSVSYGWSAWLTLNTPVEARYLRFHWDDNFDALNEIEAEFVEATQDNNPPEFANFAPVGWVTDTHEVEVSIEAIETGSVISGLNPDSTLYSFTTDARVTWSSLLPATANFPPRSPGPEVLSATIDFGVDSEDLQREGDSLHWVRFQIDDVAGNRGYSEEYPVHIDTTPPQPRGFIYQSHTPEQWSGDPTVEVQWIPALDTSSGVAGYDVHWVQLTEQNKECPTPSSVSPAHASTSPVLADADNWYVCIWARDNAGHWSREPGVGGPYWIDAQPPEAISNLQSASHGAARWTNEPLVEMSWSVPVGGATGYAYIWDQNPNTAPTTAMDTTTNTQVSATLPADHNTWYFHVVAYDQAGNYGPVAHYGPLGLDRTSPDAPYILGPPSGWVTSTVTVRWTPQGAGQGSPVAVHSYEWGISSIQPPDDVVDTLDTRATNDTPFSNGQTVYLTVKSRDQAGNWGPYAIAGPYNVDAYPPSCAVDAVTGDDLVSAGVGSQYLSLRTEFSLDAFLQNPPGSTGSPEWIDVQYSETPTGPWTTWLYQGSPGRRQFSGAQQNVTYYFRCRGGDEAGNAGPFAPERTRVTVHVPDLRITRVEITQGIQDASNSVPLVEDKPTWVRVYIDDPGLPSNAANADVPNVVAILYGLRGNGTALPGSPLGPACLTPQAGCTSARTIPGLHSTSEDGSSTLNFYLPPSWLQGNIRLQAEVNPPIFPGNTRAIEETNYGNNVTSFQDHRFFYKYPLYVTPIRINYTQDPNNPLIPPADAFQQTRSFTQKIWSSPYIQQGVPAGPDILDFAGDLTTGAGWSELLNELGQMRANASAGSLDYWYGLVPSIANPANQGKAPLNGTVAAGIAGQGPTMAHELGHNFGRLHAPCGQPPNVDPNFPNPDGSIGEVGFDPLTAETYSGSTADIMSYCASKWLSPYTFQALFDNTYPWPWLAAPLAAQEPLQAHLMVSGLIPEDGPVAFNPVHRLDLDPTPDVAPGAGPYRIELHDSDGQILDNRSFDLFHDLTFFSQILPEPADLARVVLLRDEQVLGAIDASANAPQISLLEPAAGEPLSDAVTARWQATDADGDSLIYALQYSPDGGESWSPIAHGLRQTNYTFALEDLAGSEQGLLRVIASDGFHSAPAVSDGFLQIPDHAPQAIIVYPADYQMLDPEQVLILQGQGLDKEDGELAPEQLIWSSDRDGMLGTGREIIAQEMSPGWHTITLTVTDNDERQSDATIRLYVGPIWQNHLPLVAHD